MPEVPRHIRIAGTCLGWALAAAVAIWAFGWWIPGLRHQAAAAMRDGRIEVIFSDAPRWMTASDIAPLQQMVLREAGRGAYDQVGCAQARTALLESGWFSDVTQVRRTGDGNIAIDATFAVPFALVVDDVGAHLIDVDGRLLPRSYELSSAPAFPRIMGASMPRPARPGRHRTRTAAASDGASARPWRPSAAASMFPRRTPTVSRKRSACQPRAPNRAPCLQPRPGRCRRRTWDRAVVRQAAIR